MGVLREHGANRVSLNFEIFLFKMNFFIVSDHFNVLISKIIFKKSKNFILMYFYAKNTLNRHQYYNLKHILNIMLFR